MTIQYTSVTSTCEDHETYGMTFPLTDLNLKHIQKCQKIGVDPVAYFESFGLTLNTVVINETSH